MRSSRIADTSFDVPQTSEQYVIADSAFPSTQAPTLSSASIDSQQNRVSKNNLSLENDIEQGSRIDERSVAYNNEVPVVVSHKTVFAGRRIRAACLGGGMIVVLFILFQAAFQSSKKPQVQEACDAKLSPPYVSDRNLSWTLCVMHQDPQFINLPLKQALIPDSRTSETRLSFLVIGDFGRDGYCCQRDVAIEMERATGDIDPEFVVNTGDAFYDSGIETEKDEQVRTSFLNVYNQTRLKNLHFHSVIGNHEYRGSTNALLKLNARHKRWVLEDRYWSEKIEVGTAKAGTLKVQFVYLDTSPMIESYKQPGWDSPTDIMLKRPDGISTQWDKIEDQAKWLEDQLSKGKYDARIVVGHHPIYGWTAHKGEDRKFLQDRIAPILQAYNVTAYFSGHDHNLQYTQVNKLAHFLSGAGSKITAAYEVDDTPNGALKFYHLTQGFMACTLYKDELRVAVVDLTGKVLESVSVVVR